MLRIYIYTLLLLLSSTSIIAQNSTYNSPLDIPLSLSGNFGEIRSNHFHSGVDFKTGNVEGKNVYTVADGYISRIYVSPTGFGNALYVTHPTLGTQSVYGHLQSFTDDIMSYVRENQYNKKSFSVDLYPPKDMFFVAKGDKIAASGDTGSSGGPHLHFEIRDINSGKTLNIIKNGIYKIADDIAPVIASISLVEIDTVDNVPIHTTVKTVAVKNINGKYALTNDTLAISKPSYFVMEVTDRKTSSSNIFGIAELTVTRSSQPYYGFSIDKLSFEETRYINTLCKFPETKSNKNDKFRTYISPNNKLSIYKEVVSRGVITPQSIKDVEPINIEVTDDSGNSSYLDFSIMCSENPTEAPTKIGKPVYWKTGGVVKLDSIYVKFPENALYESELIDIITAPKPKGCYSDLYIVSRGNIMLHKSVEIKIVPDNLPENLRSKALIVSYKSGSMSNVGGKWEEGYITAKSSTLGNYTVTLDTLAPRITPLFKSEETQTTKRYISFKITDNLSGIKSYHAEINGKWALMEYDAKNNTIRHPINDGIVKKGEANTLVLTVSDAKGNTTKRTYKFL